MKRLFATILAITLLFSTVIPAIADNGGGGGGAAYLKMGTGARPLALGGAFTALAEGAAATYYNPAGLGMLKMREMETMHAVLTLDRNLDYFAYAQPIKNKKIGGVLSFGWIKYGVDGIPETRIYNAGDVIPAGQAIGDPILDAGGNVRVFSYFEDVENAYTLAYGKQMREKVYAGAAVNFYTHKLFNNKADGMGLDLGVLWLANERSKIGLTVKHLGAELKWDTASARKDDIPVSTVLGATYKIRKNIEAALDLEKTGDEDLRPHLGIEGWVNKNLALRAGLDKDNLTLGLGFKNKEWCFDYGFADQDLGDVHRVSATKRF